MSILRDSKRVVVKVGTSTLTHKTGMLNIRRIENLVKVLSDLKNAGKEIVLVTSGAIGVGVGKLSLSKRPRTSRQSRPAPQSDKASSCMYMTSCSRNITITPLRF